MGFFDDDPYPGDKEIKNLNSFELPLYLFGASIGTLILGFIVHSCCLGSWRKKVESQKLRLERQRIEEIEEEAKHARCVPTDPVRLGKGLKNIDIIYVFLWIALCLAVIASKLMRQKFFDACDRGCSTQWKYLAHFGTVSTASLGVHSGLVPIVLILKCLGFHPSDIIDSLKSKPREQVDEKGGKWRVFSAKMTCCMKVYFYMVGWVLQLVNKILTLIATYLFVDLRILYFPSPFVEFSETSAVIQTMRVNKRTVKFDADFGDVYLRHCLEKLLSFLTLSLSDKCGAEQRYNKWLDSKMRFVGLPPTNGANVFTYHAAKPSCDDRCTACCYAACIPIVGGCLAERILTLGTLNNMRLGGIKVTLDSGLDGCGWIGLNIKTCCKVCGFCPIIFWKQVDKHVTPCGYDTGGMGKATATGAAKPLLQSKDPESGGPSEVMMGNMNSARTQYAGMNQNSQMHVAGQMQGSPMQGAPMQQYPQGMPAYNTGMQGSGQGMPMQNFGMQGNPQVQGMPMGNPRMQGYGQGMPMQNFGMQGNPQVNSQCMPMQNFGMHGYPPGMPMGNPGMQGYSQGMPMQNFGMQGNPQGYSQGMPMQSPGMQGNPQGYSQGMPMQSPGMQGNLQGYSQGMPMQSPGMLGDIEGKVVEEIPSQVVSSASEEHKPGVTEGTDQTASTTADTGASTGSEVSGQAISSATVSHAPESQQQSTSEGSGQQ